MGRLFPSSGQSIGALSSASVLERIFRVYSLWIDWFDTHKQTQWIKDLKVRPDIIKLLDENTGRTLLAINHSNIFCQTSPRVKEIKKKMEPN